MGKTVFETLKERALKKQGKNLDNANTKKNSMPEMEIGKDGKPTGKNIGSTSRQAMEELTRDM